MKPQAQHVLKGMTNEQLYWLGHFLYYAILKDDLNIGEGVSDAINHYCRAMSVKGVDADDIREQIRGAIFKVDSAARHTAR
jgi:hypothetical protein